MEETTTYIPFGESGQIELNPLMEALANNVNSYVESKPWSRKKKDRFMSAYSSLMSRGIVGASIKDGLWYIDYNGDPLEGVDSKDKDMYELAAYFIKSLMLGLAKDVEKEEEKDLPLFGNKYFIDLFEKHLLNNEFGGRPISTQEDWNTLDERDSKTGLRGITNRANILARNLESFSKSLEDGKYDFKDSPYRDLDDVRERISGAIAALRTPDPSDDKAALNKLGIDYNKWLYDGGDDTVTVDGQLMTTRDYYGTYKPGIEKAKAEQEAAQLKLKQALEAAKLAQLRQTLFSSLKFYTPKSFSGSFADFQRKYAGQNLGELFSSLASTQLNSEQSNDLNLLFREAERTGLLLELSNEEKQAFGRFNNLIGRLRKVGGIEGFYWDTAAKRIVLPSKINGQSIIGGSSTNLLTPPSENELELQKREKANQRQLRNLETEDVARITAISADLVGLLASFVPGVGTGIAAGTGLTSLGAHLVADIADESVSKSQVFWNTLANAGLSVVSLLPGGGLTKLTKILKAGATYLPLLLGAVNSYLDRALIESAFKKIGHPGDITNEELKAVAYAMTTLAGGARVGRGVYNERKYGPAFTGKTTKVLEAEVYNTKTKKIERVKVDADKAKRLNSAKPKTKEDADKIIKETLGEQYEAPSTFKPASILSKPLKTKSTPVHEEGNREYREFLEQQNREYREQNPWARRLRTTYDIYNRERPYLRGKILDKLGISNKSIVDRWRTITENPYEKWKKENAPVSEKTSPSSTDKVEPSLERDMKKVKDILKEYKEFGKGNFTSKEVEGGEFTLNGNKIKVSVSEVGGKKSYYLEYAGGTTKNFSTLLELKLKIFEIIQKNRKTFDKSTKTTKKKTTEEIGEYLKALKAKGWLKQGGKFTSRLILENFYKTL